MWVRTRPCGAAVAILVTLATLIAAVDGSDAAVSGVCDKPGARSRAEAGDLQGALDALLPCTRAAGSGTGSSGGTSPDVDADGALWWNVGALQLRIGDARAAARSIHQALLTDPSRTDWQDGLGIAQLRAGQYKAAVTTIAGAITVRFGGSWRDVTDPAAMPDLERLLTAFRGAGLFDNAYDVFTRLRVLAGFKADPRTLKAARRSSGDAVEHAAAARTFSQEHDQLLARQAVFASSVGRVMDGVELSALGLRHRLARELGADATRDDPRLLVVPRRVLLLAMTGMEAHMTSVARNLLSPGATATINSLATHCRTKPSLTDDGQSITRANLIAVATACSTEQALLESAYTSDHESGAAAVAESNAFGWTPLHYAVALGESGAVADLIERGADVNARTQHGLTPLHVCVTWGTTHLFNSLRGTGAKLVAYDTWGRTPLALWCGRGWGTELASSFVDCDAMDVAGGRGARARLLAASDSANELTERLARVQWGKDPAVGHDGDDSTSGDDVWGGWQTPSLTPAQAQQCDIDVAAADMSAADVVRDYLSVHKPVLIRGALLRSKHWRRVAYRVSRCVPPAPCRANSSARGSRVGRGRGARSQQLVERYGDTHVDVGRIPYASTFGLPSRPTTLADAVHRMSNSSSAADEYVFASLPTSTPIIDDNVKVPRALDPEVTGIVTSKAQVYVGARGTGAPPHFHRSAWNALVHGAKAWQLRPPPVAIYSTRPAASFFDDAETGEVAVAAASGDASGAGREDGTLRCTQLSGDVLIVPDSWSHAVLNLGDSVGFASEFVWGPGEFSV